MRKHLILNLIFMGILGFAIECLFPLYPKVEMWFLSISHAYQSLNCLKYRSMLTAMQHFESSSKKKTQTSGLLHGRGLHIFEWKHSL